MDLFKNAGITTEEFLNEYWQKKPLYIPQAFSDFQPLITPDELAGLACEENIESRIILEEGIQRPWELLTGPFDGDAFSTLPEEKWTLLVQAVDQIIPEAGSILDRFNFIPNWRLDDLMVSFAVPGGSVGPHYDQYDVFLLQAEGERLWQIGAPCDKNTQFRKDTPLHILTEFNATQEWLTKPGDLLYIPPRAPHLGVAQTACQTYSIGFRAPSHGEIIEHFSSFMADKLSQDQRFTDKQTTSKNNPGLITETTIDQLMELVHEAMNDRNGMKDWFAGFMSEPKFEENKDEITFSISTQEMTAILNSSCELIRSEQSRFVYTRSDIKDGQGSNQFALFVNGNRIESEGKNNTLIELLCEERCINIEKHITLLTQEENINIIKHLYEQDRLYVE